MIGYIYDKNGKVRGSSIIGTSQSFFVREFEYAKYDINTLILRENAAITTNQNDMQMWLQSSGLLLGERSLYGHCR